MAQSRNLPSRPDVTRHLAEFCSGLAFDDLPEETIGATKKAVVDTLAASYAGVKTDPGQIMIDFLATKPAGEVTVIGTDLDLSAEFAALGNGTTAHALDVDDGHRGASGHPGSPIIPAALAIAEREDIGGRSFLPAVVAGYEAFARIAEAVQTSHRNRGFHATATVGCFGAAAAAASLLELDEQTTAHALGLAGSQAGGLFEFLEKGSMVKRFHPGRAGMAGILAADLAKRGFDGPDTIIEGTDGFATAFSDDYDLSVLDELGNPYAIEEGYLKPFPCCRHIHGPIEAALEIRDRIGDVEEIASIRVETYGTAAKHNKKSIDTLLDAQMSMPFGVAVALLEGQANLKQFDPHYAELQSITDLMNSVEITTTAEMEAQYPETRPCRVTIETRTDSHTVSIDYPLGAAENPLSRSDLEEKFIDLSQEVLDRSEQEAIMTTAFDLESLDSVRELGSRL